MKAVFNSPRTAGAALAVVCMFSFVVDQPAIAEEGDHFVIGDDKGKMGLIVLLFMCSKTWERSVTQEEMGTPEGQMFLQGREMLIEGTKIADRRKMREGLRMMVKAKRLIEARRSATK